MTDLGQENIDSTIMKNKMESIFLNIGIPQSIMISLESETFSHGIKNRNDLYNKMVVDCYGI